MISRWSPHAPVQERLAFGFGSSVFDTRPGGQGWKVEDLPGSGSRPGIRTWCAKDRGLRDDATVIRLDGAVEISVQLGVADAIADVVRSGRSSGWHDLVAFGESLCDSEGVLIEREVPDASDGGRT